MLTISIYEELSQQGVGFDSPRSLEDSDSTGITEINKNNSEQIEADQYIKEKIQKIIKRDGEDEISDSIHARIAARGAKRNNERKFWAYMKTGGIFAAHIAGVYVIKFFSYKMISNQDALRGVK